MNVDGSILFEWIRLRNEPKPPAAITYVSHEYNNPACKPWTFRQWGPQGYSSREEVAREIQKQDERKLERLGR
jgi:hypothetical protein